MKQKRGRACRRSTISAPLADVALISSHTLNLPILPPPPSTYLGITPPVSISGPTPRDLEVSSTLVAELNERGVYESAEEGKSRELVLDRLTALVKKFVYRSSLNHGLSEAQAREAYVTVLPVACLPGVLELKRICLLGVHGPGSDIDTLLVVPSHVERDEFFTLFEDMLKGTEGVLEVAPVPEAYVPIIKCTISGIEIDLLFASLALPTVPDDLSLEDDSLLKNLDERCVRSLGGSRVTDQILALVPSVPVFRDALRTIKLWARRRAIYSNVMGFCGGVAWAMMVARICQLYPNGCLGSIISRFFIIMHQWQWPSPLLLKSIEEGPLQVRVWNPKLYPSDRAHRMPIITPAYPAMCSTHNVTLSTQAIMTSEFKRASEIVDKVIVGSAPWSDLFAPHDFFHQYRYYLQITASSTNADSQLKWSGTVESRVRQLVIKLEYTDSLALAHPFVKGFDRINYCIDEAEQHEASIGNVSPTIAARTAKDLENVPGGGHVVHTTSFYIGLSIEKRPPGPGGPRKLDISYPSHEFTKQVKMWDKYDETSMGVIVRHIKSNGLPDYVFEGKSPETTKGGGTKRTKSQKVPGKVKVEPPLSALSPTSTPTVPPPPSTDDDSQRSSKKIRSSSFVPDGDSPVAGVTSPPEPASTSEKAALVAAELATSGGKPNGGTMSPEGGQRDTAGVVVG
ncbi:poly(A) polymerase Pla1 [Pseudohyphozyma bogoriensis]|nr:poly(A) polymerase Pla1 [Pseudohyphozyma bogoriensis]